MTYCVDRLSLGLIFTIHLLIHHSCNGRITLEIEYCSPRLYTYGCTRTPTNSILTLRSSMWHPSLTLCVHAVSLSLFPISLSLISLSRLHLHLSLRSSISHPSLASCVHAHVLCAPFNLPLALEFALFSQLITHFRHGAQPA